MTILFKLRVGDDFNLVTTKELLHQLVNFINIKRNSKICKHKYKAYMYGPRAATQFLQIFCNKKNLNVVQLCGFTNVTKMS